MRAVIIAMMPPSHAIWAARAAWEIPVLAFRTRQGEKHPGWMVSHRPIAGRNNPVLPVDALTPCSDDPETPRRRNSGNSAEILGAVDSTSYLVKNSAPFLVCCRIYLTDHVGVLRRRPKSDNCISIFIFFQFAI